MAGLKNIQSKIRATERINKVTKAMEAVSAVKMRKSQQTALAGRTYASAAVSVLGRLSSSKHLREHPLFQPHGGKKTLILLVTSDKGLAGSLNASVLKELELYLNEQCPDRSLVDVYAIGRKGNVYAKNHAHTVIGYTENKEDDVSIEQMRDVVDIVTTRYMSGEYGTVAVAYSNFKSTFEQKAVVRPFLPLSLELLTSLVHDITPEKGKYSMQEEHAVQHYTVEPNAHEVLDILIPKLLTIAVYHILLESKASEHSARMVAMKNASDKSKEVQQGLKLKFNRARQSVITREVSEIIGGIEAMATNS